MAAEATLGVLAFFLHFSLVLADDSQRVLRFEYKHCFKGPHLVNKQGVVPFWEVGGSAIPSDDQVRITPSLRDKKGYMWTKNEYTSRWFEIEVALKVTGQGRVGADGMAIWYRDVKGEEGNVFGSNNQWNGLGILLDSFDNDGQQNNPFISVMVNDGTKLYEHHNDGVQQTQGGCLRNFRNRPYPAVIKARYYENVLTVWFHQGMSQKPEFELCTRVENVQLPEKGVFGISAATGGLADDHDAITFITHSINTPTDKDSGKKLTEDEIKKLSDQYDEMAEKFQKEKDEYAKAHPSKQDSPEEQYQTPYERDLRMIYEGQNALHHIVNNLHKKTVELTVQVNELQQVITTRADSQGGGGQGETINRQEVNSIINLQNQLSSNMNEVKNLVEKFGHNRERRETGNGNDVTSEISGLRGSMEVMMENMNHLLTKQKFVGNEGNKACPTVEQPNCIGPGYFVFLIIVQMILFISYLSYQSYKEAAAKKFF